ncbi:MAG TPA: deoxyribodipyrimidine photo-lyase [Casimicrobiaceae bacterium]|nr:deoxyribodipyrimidine photo-lyase [Casimicrobiaceae bacterium]
MSDAWIDPERIVELNEAPERPGDYVLYWMQQSQREPSNPALELAVAEANRLALPVVVGFGLTDAYPEANARHYTFMLEGLAETKRAIEERGIRFVVRRGEPDDVAIALAQRAALVVCDRGYLRAQRAWRKHVAAKAGRRVVQVEGDVVVPIGVASTRREIAARTLRPRLAARLEDFLEPLARTRPLVDGKRLPVHSDVALDDVAALVRSLRIDQSVPAVTELRGGHSEARRRLDAFLARSLDRYVDDRARPGDPHVSTMSPYLHFGQISPVEIALAIRAAQADARNRDAYIEQLIVRRELSMNFVSTTPDYDRYDCVPAWAQQTLDAHRNDPRPTLYTKNELAHAATHDPYWNAAMSELSLMGFMHNHMRMYWGKKVLEWSASPEAAFSTLLQLNNRYFIDGRDANSYANVAWVFGLHDRPWPERPIFGSVRYMNAAGLERKTDVGAYVARIEALRDQAH